MTTIRYFKATDGDRTFFRASPTRVYLSASVFPDYRDFVLHWDARGPFPVTEITRQEFKALVALKAARIEREKAAYRAAHPGTPNSLSSWGTAPRDSWVANEDIEAETVAA